MAKARPRRKVGKKAKNAQMVRSRPPAVPPRLPAHNAEYARLLSNPCTGPLVHAPGSSSGGLVTRFESDYIVGSGATETAGYILVAPGAINNAGTATISFGSSVAVGANDTTPLVPGTGGAGTYVPGLSYLQANASSYRCIAACMQLYWPGSEVNRSGIVSGAQATYGLLKNGVNDLSVSQARSLCPIVERMPNECFEIKWAPNFTDGLFRNPYGSTVPEDGHSGMLMTWSGIPVSTGVRIRVVCVYEWQPKLTGLTLNSNTSGAGSGEIQQIRTALDKLDPSWWYNLGTAVRNFGSGLAIAYQAARGPNFVGQNRLRLEL